MSNHGRDEVDKPKPLKKEEEMTEKVRKDGACSLCGKAGRTILVAGAHYCATCVTITSIARNHAPLALAQIREFHPELLEGSGTGEDRQALNAELAAAFLVQQLRDMEQVNTLLGDEAKFHTAEILRLKDIGLELNDILLGVPVASLTDTARQRMNELQSLRVEMAELSASGPQALLDAVFPEEAPVSTSSPEYMELKGELEGLQDVLSSWEQERATMLQERARQTEQVLQLREELAAAARKVAGLEQECDRLQECKVGVLDTTLCGGPAGSALPLAEDHAGREMLAAAAALQQITPEVHFLIDADDDLFLSAGMPRGRSFLADVKLPGQEIKKNVMIQRMNSFPADNPTLTGTQLAISAVCDGLRSRLIDKNRAYGNSALEPLRVFSKASPQEQILVRIDDKLSRLSRGGEFPGDDTVMDLAGYLVLLMVQRGSEQMEVAA